MANTIKRMSRSQARRRETPLFLAVLDLVDQADAQQEEVLDSLCLHCDRAARNLRARSNQGRAGLLEGIGNAIKSYAIGVNWSQIPTPVEDDDAEDERQPPAHRVHWPSQEGN